MYVLYTVLLLLAGLGLLPSILWRCLRGATYHQDLAERCGYGIVPPTEVQAGSGCLWFHAASVGEVQGVRPIIARLHQCLGDGTGATAQFDHRARLLQAEPFGHGGSQRARAG